VSWEPLADVVKRLRDGTPPPPWAGLFGGSPRPEDCRLVLMPVPWDATVSYGVGTAKGPEAVLGASHQLDLEDLAFERPYEAGITLLPEDREIVALNGASRDKAARIIEEAGPHDPDSADLKAVNEASLRVNERVRLTAEEHLRAGRLVGVLGGDHSSPYGLIKALADVHPDGFGILHFDAHFDLRKAYEGFVHSHASIMHNVMETIPAVKCLVQVGIRDFSHEELSYAKRLGPRQKTFFARDLFRRKARGESFAETTRAILEALPEKVYVSFDIDGLDPAFCPSTGTPVPGGLSFDEANFILEELALGGRTIVGFDLCEVAPDPAGEDEWDANVGARILYKLCGATIHSHGYCKAQAER
jgi:agmatinase